MSSPVVGSRVTLSDGKMGIIKDIQYRITLDIPDQRETMSTQPGYFGISETEYVRERLGKREDIREFHGGRRTLKAAKNARKNQRRHSRNRGFR